LNVIAMRLCGPLDFQSPLALVLRGEGLGVRGKRRFVDARFFLDFPHKTSLNKACLNDAREPLTPPAPLPRVLGRGEIRSLYCPVLENTNTSKNASEQPPRSPDDSVNSVDFRTYTANRDPFRHVARNAGWQSVANEGPSR